MTDQQMFDPDFLSITILSEGYVINYQGKSFALGSPADVTKRLKILLTEEKKARDALPPNQIRRRVEHLRVVDVPPPPYVQETPVHAGPGHAPVAQPQREAAPVPQEVNLANSRANLQELVRRRVVGHPDVASDRAFFHWVGVYCPGIEEGEAVDALDEAMSNQPPPAIPGEAEGVRYVPGQAPEPDPTQYVRPAQGRFADPNLYEMSPAQFVDQVILDEETGEVVDPDEVLGHGFIDNAWSNRRIGVIGG